MTPTLNWRELAHVAELLRDSLDSTFVERVHSPERARSPGGYIKGEWAIRLTSRRSERALVFSVRSRRPYVYLAEPRSTRPAKGATRSAFDLALGKFLKGARLLQVETPPRERAVMLWFGVPGAPEGGTRLGLILLMIPAMPEALLIQAEPGTSGDWPILARSRTVKEGTPDTWSPPDGSQAPMEPPFREETVGDLDRLREAIERGLEQEAFELRLRAAERSLKELLKLSRERIRLNETAVREAESDPDWRSYGDLLKASLPEVPPLVAGNRRRLLDYSTDTWIEVPCDPKLGPQAQVEKFYQLSRRKARRLEEATSRLATFRESRDRLEAALAKSPSPLDWPGLAKFEEAAGTATTKADPAPVARKGANAWLGRTFRSKDGYTILVGRSRDENLDLTFKHARGNDLWLHVRGKPGAHVVIPLPSGKSAPLDTLLDAANLCIHYSGGENWGKTEVDYTFKKYVKRIRDSTEASYSNNKTLIVAPDPERIKRLQG